MLPACRHDPVIVEPKMMDTIPADTSEVCHPDTIYFRKDVLPIILSSCGMELCHDAVTRQEGLQFTSYQTLINSGRLIPFDAEGSDIYQRMTSQDIAMVMPPSPRGPISDTNILVIKRWIDQGAQYLDCPDDTTCTIQMPLRFSRDVWPVIDKHCTGCHKGANPWADLYLRNYDEVKAIADIGLLVEVISHDPGVIPMPYNQGRLSQCIIDKISMWVDAGAPNN